MFFIRTVALNGVPMVIYRDACHIVKRLGQMFVRPFLIVFVLCIISLFVYNGFAPFVVVLIFF